jgi:hypothetical protein
VIAMLPTHVTEFTIALTFSDVPSWRSPTLLKLKKSSDNGRWWWMIQSNGKELCMFDVRVQVNMADTADLAVADFRSWLKELDAKIASVLG